MPQHLIAIYGGTELDGPTADFVRLLTRALLAYSDVTLVTGGFLRNRRWQEGVSTDYTVASAVQEFVKERGHALQDRLQTWIPEKDERKKSVERFALGEVRTVKGSAQKRRLALVDGVDAVVTVKGIKHTQLVLDMAIAIEKPALPLPFTGGDSVKYWRDNKGEISATFQLSALTGDLESFNLTDEPVAIQRKLAEDLAERVHHAITRNCLILSSFGSEASAFQREVVVPAIEEAGFRAIRIDWTTDTGNIFTIFQKRLGSSAAVIADITEGSPNVLYELGFAHARGIEPFLFARTELTSDSGSKLKFYVRQQQVVAADANTIEGRARISSAIRAFLEAARTVNALRVAPPAQLTDSSQPA